MYIILEYFVRILWLVVRKKEYKGVRWGEKGERRKTKASSPVERSAVNKRTPRGRKSEGNRGNDQLSAPA